MELLQRLTPFIGRLLLVLIFLLSGIRKIFEFTGTAEFMEQNNMVLPEIFLVGAIILLLIGSLSIILGYKARYGAILLIVFLIPATLIFHTNFDDQIQFIMFLKNLSIMGGLLTIVAHGSGNFSLDGSGKIQE